MWFSKSARVRGNALQYTDTNIRSYEITKWEANNNDGWRRSRPSAAPDLRDDCQHRHGESTETGRRPAGEAGRTLRAGGCVRCPCRTVTHAPCFNGHHFGTHGQVLSNVDRAVHRVVPHGGIVRAIHYVYLDLHGSGQGREALVLSHSLQLVRFSLAGKESMEKDKTTSLVVLKRGGGPGSPLRLIPTWLSHWSLRYPLWHSLWCERGHTWSCPRWEAYCSCLPRLTQRPRPRRRAGRLCRRRARAGGTCPATDTRVRGQRGQKNITQLKYKHISTHC